MWVTSFWLVDTILLTTTVIYLFIKYMSRNYSYWKNKNVQYIEPIPVFGNFLDIALFRTTIGEYLKKLYDQTKEPFFGIYVFSTPLLILRSPELVKQVMVKDFNYFCDRTILTSEHDPLTSKMMFLEKNPEWKLIRTKMSPVFTSGKLKGMIPLINKIGKELKEYVEKIADKGVVESKEICAKFSTDVIALCAFAIQAHSFDHEDGQFRKVGRLIFDFKWKTAIQQTSFFFLPFLAKLFRMKMFDKEATDFMRDVFWKSVEIRERSGIKGNDVIDTIVELKKNEDFKRTFKFEGDAIVAQAGQFFTAGFETTSSTMAFGLYELAIHPQIQTKLRGEIIQQLKEHGGFTFEAIQSMKYLNMVVCEVLRKYPVLPFLDRRCNEDYKIPGSNVVIEKGTPVYIPMFGLHYDEQYFPEPEKFDPERFSPDNINKVVPFTYIPFGEGPRICIGERFGLMTSKLGLVHILSQFEVFKCPETPVPLKYEPKSFILASKVGIPVEFKRATNTYIDA